MILNSYDTSAAQAFDMSVVEKELRQHLILNPADDYRSQLRIIGAEEDNRPGTESFLYSVVPGDDRITPFSHPHIITTGNKSKGIFIDVRPFTRIERVSREVVICDLPQYTLLVERGLLQYAAMSEGSETLLNLGTFPITVYANWLAEVIGRRVGADLDTQTNIAVISALFFYCQFVDGDLDEREQLNACRIIGEATYKRPNEIMDLIEEIGKITNVNDYINALKQHSGSMRLDTMTLATLYSYLGGSWFGMNRIELIGVALEHVPTFIALAYTALVTRSYRNTELGKVALRYERSPNAKAFLKAYISLTERFATTQH